MGIRLLLEARNINKIYSNGKKSLEVLKGIDLSIDKGKFVAIVGPSGAGKSTLLHILGGLDSPSDGRVLFEDRDIYSLGENEISSLRNKEIGFVFQFYHLLPEFTVLENVLMPALISFQPSAISFQLRAKAGDLIEKVGLKDRSSHFPSQLSGGEKQRVAIVRGLINNPKLLLCDEPTGNLDSSTAEGIVELLRRINLENRMTVLLVTHNNELTKQADRVYHLRDGILEN